MSPDSFNRTKIVGKCQNSNETFLVIFKQCARMLKILERVHIFEGILRSSSFQARNKRALDANLEKSRVKVIMICFMSLYSKILIGEISIVVPLSSGVSSDARLGGKKIVFKLRKRKCL